jgi:hypothetical protein
MLSKGFGAEVNNVNREAGKKCLVFRKLTDLV